MLRLYYPELQAKAGLTVALSREQANHVKVRRIAVGENIILFNQGSGDWLAELSTEKIAKLQIKLRDPLVGPDLQLIVPLLAKDRFALVVEKATELGISSLQPIMTHFTQNHKFNAERTTTHMIEAAQQCERTDIPSLEKVQTLALLLRNWDPERILFVAMERREVQPIAQIFANNKTIKAAILIGPEGGFAEGEKEALLAHPSVRCFSLGPRILRAETAAIAALAVWQTN